MPKKNTPEPQTRKPSKRPGRPRSEKTRRAIMKATAVLIQDLGVPGVTIEAVAAAAGVGKPTIYRYWSNAHELAMAALMEAVPAPSNAGEQAPDTVAPLKALRTLMHTVTETFSNPAGRHVAMVLASADASSEIAKAFRSHFIQSRRKEAEALLVRGIETGELRQDMPMGIVLDMIFGAVLYRLLMGHAPITTGFMDDLLSASLKPFQTE